MSKIPISLIVGCPECESLIFDPEKICPVCRGGPIKVTLRPWERNHAAVMYDAHSITAYTAGFKDGLRLAKALMSRPPYPAFHKSNAIMHP